MDKGRASGREMKGTKGQEGQILQRYSVRRPSTESGTIEYRGAYSLDPIPGQPQWKAGLGIARSMCPSQHIDRKMTTTKS